MVAKRLSFQKFLASIYAEYKAHNENELQQRLAEESTKIPCVICKHEFPIEEIRFIDGDPYCKNHRK